MTEWFNAHFGGVAVTVEYGRGVSQKQARAHRSRRAAARRRCPPLTLAALTQRPR